MPSSNRLSFGYLMELYGPIAITIAWLIASYFLKSWLVGSVATGKIVLSGLFSAVFGWAAIQTGFLFSVFGFVATKSDGFIGQFRHSPIMKRFQRYVLQAMYMGFVLTIYSIPLMIFTLDVSGTFTYWLVSVWFASFIWAFASFLRVALNFGKMVSVKDSEFIPG